MNHLISLTLSEKETLTRYESIIRLGLDTFVEVGKALAEIRAAKLYRCDYDSFESYCRERWGMAARTAHQTIASSNVVVLLNGCDVLPARESIARVLVGLPGEEAKRLWLEALAENPNVTAARLKRLVLRLSHKKQNLSPVRASNCPACGHSFVANHPETATRGCRRPSRGVIWAIGKLPDETRSACDYGCGRLRNAPLFARFAQTVYADTKEQCRRLATISQGKQLIEVGDSRLALLGFDAVFLVCVLHVLRDNSQRQLVAAQVNDLKAEWLFVETPRTQWYYSRRMKAGHFTSREGTHYWNLQNDELDALFEEYTLSQRQHVGHNECRLYRRTAQLRVHKPAHRRTPPA